jgi:hypothetical protein
MEDDLNYLPFRLTEQVEMENTRDWLDLATHVPATGASNASDRVDARVKPAHDDLRLVPLMTRKPICVPPTPCTESRMSGRRR